MSFKGRAKRIDDVDLPIIGLEYGIGEDEVHAVLDTESAGKGFDQHSRPKMLFEPHIFWKLLGPGPMRDEAARQGLAYKSWKPGAYPRDSYPRLLKAISIHYEIALQSASWGLGQIMGFNHEAAGYATAHDMVMDFLDDEEMHLRAMFKFIKAKGLDKHLRARNWKAFAAGYNGSGFAKNGYDRKLSEAFAKWQRIKDTPIPAGYVPPEPASPPKRATVKGTISREAVIKSMAEQAKVTKAQGSVVPTRTVKTTVVKEPADPPKPVGVIPLLLGIVAGGYGAVAAWYNGNLAPVIDWLTFWN